MDQGTLQFILLALVALLICAAIIWIGFRVGRQWNHPKRRYQAQMEDIRRRKQALGIADEDE